MYSFSEAAPVSLELEMVKISEDQWLAGRVQQGDAVP